MALPQPSESEVQSILSVLCYAKVTDPEHFQAVLDFYTATVCQDPHPGHAVQISPPVLRSHQAVVEACAGLRATLSTPKSEVERQLFQDGTEEAERHRSLRTITKLALMIDCDSRSNFSVNFKRQTDEAFPTRWRDTDTFVDFFHSAFSTNETSPLRTSDIGNHLKAWKLRKRCSIRITPTNDLAQHLVYNKGSRSLSVFHQVAYLKAHLQHVSHLDISATAAESIPCGSLPPQLLLETLYTVYYILFPLSEDPKSRRLARRLVKRQGFDPNLLGYDGLARLSELENLKLVYWAKRVRTLQEIAKNPPPAYKLVSWIERHTSERNALTVALVGVFLAALFGLLGLMVGVAQFIVSILAWKHPVDCSCS